MAEIESVRLPGDATLARSTLYALLDRVRLHETIYKQAGAVHGCALATNEPESSQILTFVEDVGRHNAVDAIAGQMWLDRIDGADKIFYTTGRLTSEMVIKAAQMGIPFLVSRSGLTQMGFEIAEKVGITMIGPRDQQAFPALHWRRAFPERALIARDDVTGIVLAGGLGRRMGGVDKGLVELNGRPMVAHVLSRLAPQVGDVLINANQNAERYGALGIRWCRMPSAASPGRSPACTRDDGARAARSSSPSLRLAVRAAGSRGAARRRRSSAKARTRGREDVRPAASGVRARAARTSCPNLASFLEGGGRKIDAWYAALATWSELRRRGRRVPEHQHRRRARAAAGRWCARGQQPAGAEA
jgi:hypothetical protein